MRPPWLLALSVLVATLVAPGCGFTIPTEDAMDPPGDPTGPGSDDPGDPGVPRVCDPDDPGLRLCIDFEDAPGFGADGSGRGHDAIATDVAVMPRADQQAVLVDEDSRIAVAEHPDLDVTGALTAALWMKPDTTPEDAQYLLDNNRQYAISYQPDGRLRCALGLRTVDSRISYLDRTWHHVACVWDGAQLRVVVDGGVEGCASATSIATDGAEGLAIGANVNAGPTYLDPFEGGLDDVTVHARALTGDELCARAGRTGCATACP